MLSPHRIDILIAATIAIAFAARGFDDVRPPAEPSREQRRRLRQLERKNERARAEVHRALEQSNAALELAAVIDEADREAARFLVIDEIEGVDVDAALAGAAVLGAAVGIALELGVDMASGEDATALVDVGTDQGPGESPVATPLEAAAAPLADGAVDGPPEQCGGS